MQNRTAAAVASDLLWAKAEEEQARQERLELENELLGLIGDTEDGTETHKIEDYTVKVVAKVTRTVDPDMWGIVTHDLSDEEFPIEMNPITIEERYKVSGPICRELQKYNPELFATLSRAITTKKNKSTITVFKVEAE